MYGGRIPRVFVLVGKEFAADRKILHLSLARVLTKRRVYIKSGYVGRYGEMWRWAAREPTGFFFHGFFLASHIYISDSCSDVDGYNRMAYGYRFSAGEGSREHLFARPEREKK